MIRVSSSPAAETAASLGRVEIRAENQDLPPAFKSRPSKRRRREKVEAVHKPQEVQGGKR
jgi:hypothetical protein